MPRSLRSESPARHRPGGWPRSPRGGCRHCRHSDKLDAVPIIAPRQLRRQRRLYLRNVDHPAVHSLLHDALPISLRVLNVVPNHDHHAVAHRQVIERRIARVHAEARAHQARSRGRRPALQPRTHLVCRVRYAQNRRLAIVPVAGPVPHVAAVATAATLTSSTLYPSSRPASFDVSAASICATSIIPLYILSYTTLFRSPCASLTSYPTTITTLSPTAR